MTAKRRLLTSCLLALLSPLPLPHVDSYLPLVLGLGAAALAVGASGPLYLLLMIGVFVVYAAAAYGLLTLAGWWRRRGRA